VKAVPTVREFTLPDLGEGLTSAEIVRWLVEPGDVVAVDQPVVEVETAKAMVEVPCPYAGVVTARFGEPGEELPVGAALVTVAVAAPADATTSEGSGNVLVGYGTGNNHTTAPRRRRVRPPAGTGAPKDDPGTRQEAKPSAPPAAPTTVAPQSPGPVPVISPLVRRLARENGVDLLTLSGSGPDGLIMRVDVDRAIAARRRQPQATAPADAATDADVTPFSPTQRAAAALFARSRREIPDATCWVDADATELLVVRNALNPPGAEPRIGVLALLALLARICVAALARYPQLNSTVATTPDGTPTGIRRNRAVHLGFAAQTERGLMVPVIHDAHRMTTADLAAAVARTTATAHEGRLTPADLTGGTFTLNNYGVFGVDGSTPIINHPETAMLGVGRVTPKPWVYQDELAVRQVVQLSLTFDHRVCDGATAGGFLRLVADAVENPASLLRWL
jgi:2-oxoisovalerate dehydrogenase E2 component (dihydrolipoyl transacylase)